MLLQGKSLVGMVMARVPMFSPTGGASAEGALGEHPDEEVIQGLDLPLVDRGENPVLNTTESTAGPAAAETSSSQPGEVKASTTPQQPFLLSNGLTPVPPKLVTKIQKLEFVDMAELLRDNLEMQRQVTSQDQSSTPAVPLRNRRREIPDLLSWVSCFGVAIYGGAYQQASRDD